MRRLKESLDQTTHVVICALCNKTRVHKCPAIQCTRGSNWCFRLLVCQLLTYNASNANCVTSISTSHFIKSTTVPPASFVFWNQRTKSNLFNNPKLCKAPFAFDLLSILSNCKWWLAKMWLINCKMTVDAAERLPDPRRRLFSSVNLFTSWMTSRRLTGWESVSLLTSDQEQLQIYSPVYLIRALCGWHSCHPPPPACETNLFNPGCSGDHPHTHPPRPPLSAKRSAWISAWRSAAFSSLPESITGSWRNGNWSGGGTPVLA